MTFTPYTGKVEFEPIEADSAFSNEGTKVNAGRIIQKGLGVGESINIGDIVFFLEFGAEQTPEYEGETHWVLEITSRFVLGFIHV
jgi:hypothetical protein